MGVTSPNNEAFICCVALVCNGCVVAFEFALRQYAMIRENANSSPRAERRRFMFPLKWCFTVVVFGRP